MWKHLTHQNVLPLLGVTIDPFQLVSGWMSGGDLPDYIKRNPDADRLGLVGVPRHVYPPLTPISSCPTSLGVSATYTPAI